MCRLTSPTSSPPHHLNSEARPSPSRGLPTHQRRRRTYHIHGVREATSLQSDAAVPLVEGAGSAREAVRGRRQVVGRVDYQRRLVGVNHQTTSARRVTQPAAVRAIFRRAQVRRRQAPAPHLSSCELYISQTRSRGQLLKETSHFGDGCSKWENNFDGKGLLMSLLFMVKYVMANDSSHIYWH